MVATSDEELQQQILKEAEKAMNNVAKKAKTDMDEAIRYFYKGGKPRMYVRTYNLSTTPETTPVTTSGNTLEFEARLRQGGVYSTGKHPSMTDVLNLTNDGTTKSSVGVLRPAVGSKGYWERAEKNIENSFNSIMSKQFS